MPPAYTTLTRLICSTIGVLLWAMGAEGASIKSINFTSTGVYSGGVGAVASEHSAWSQRASL